MAEYEQILYEVKDGIARVTLNRPEKRNALNDKLVGEMKSALALAATDAGVRVVLIEGAGKDFCSGADLAGLQRARENSVEQNLANARWMGDLFINMRRHPRPIIAAVKGRALAGGCGLATACDLILASESAKFGYPEVNIGFVPAMVMAILRRSVTEKRSFELITSGEIISAETATDIGLINHWYPDEQFDQAVQDYTARMAARSASAVSLCKSLLYQMDAMSFEAALEAGVSYNAIARMTDDCKAGIDRFLKK